MNSLFNLPPGVLPTDIDPLPERDEDAALDAADHENDILRESDPDNEFRGWPPAIDLQQ